uniref:Uncharacterized protein n=1 Tax=Anguilla anguilla TaxID=7936 RepID=A0A0E9XIJ8_ANGAN
MSVVVWSVPSYECVIILPMLRVRWVVSLITGTVHTRWLRPGPPPVSYPVLRYGRRSRCHAVQSASPDITV